MTEDSVSVFDQFLFLAYLISDNTRYLDRKSLFLAKLELSLFKSMTIVISKEGTSWTGCIHWFQNQFKSYWINRNSLFHVPLAPYIWSTQGGNWPPHPSDNVFVDNLIILFQVPCWECFSECWIVILNSNVLMIF